MNFEQKSLFSSPKLYDDIQREEGNGDRIKKEGSSNAKFELPSKMFGGLGDFVGKFGFSRPQGVQMYVNGGKHEQKMT